MVVVVIAVAGLGAYSFLPGTVSTTTTSASSATTSGYVAPVSSSLIAAFDCSSPAITSQYSCDQLPSEYQLAPRYPNGPPPFCIKGMSASACSLLKTTQGNGVCDPNETPWTSPIDCGCTGALTGDPYTGRCSTPAAVCLFVGPRQQPIGG